MPPSYLRKLTVKPSPLAWRKVHTAFLPPAIILPTQQHQATCRPSPCPAGRIPCVRPTAAKNENSLRRNSLPLTKDYLHRSLLNHVTVRRMSDSHIIEFLSGILKSISADAPSAASAPTSYNRRSACTGNAKGQYVLFAGSPHVSLHKKSPVKQPHLIEASQDIENV